MDDDDDVSRKFSQQSSQRKKYRILSQRKRQSCPAIFSVNDDEQAEHYLQLADKHLILGNHGTASRYYSVVLDREFRKTTEEIEADLNNNDAVFCAEKVENRANSKWAEEYLNAKNNAVEEKMSISPTDHEVYLQKAALLFFQNAWKEARDVLNRGLLKCSKKSAIRLTLRDLDKLEKLYQSINIGESIN